MSGAACIRLVEGVCPSTQDRSIDQTQELSKVLFDSLTTGSVKILSCRKGKGQFDTVDFHDDVDDLIAPRDGLNFYDHPRCDEELLWLHDRASGDSIDWIHKWCAVVDILNEAVVVIEESECAACYDQVAWQEIVRLYQGAAQNNPIIG